MLSENKAKSVSINVGSISLNILYIYLNLYLISLPAGIWWDFHCWFLHRTQRRLLHTDALRSKYGNEHTSQRTPQHPGHTAAAESRPTMLIYTRFKPPSMSWIIFSCSNNLQKLCHKSNSNSQFLSGLHQNIGKAHNACSLKLIISTIHNWGKSPPFSVMKFFGFKWP